MSTLDNLAYFTGSEERHRWSMLFPHFYLTDGAKYLAEEAKCYWLMDIIGSYQPQLLKKGEHFQVWFLYVDTTSCNGWVRCEDGNDHRLVVQDLEYTDFPLPEMKLYAIYTKGDGLIIMLPSEY